MNKRLMVLLLATVSALLPLRLSAQTYYTLTNGHVYWYDYPTWLGESYESRQTELTFAGTHESYSEVHKYGGLSLKNNTEHGDIYAALDITDVNDPKVVPATEFSPKCLWQRSSVTGYYFQVWDGNRYYLIGGRTGLKVVKVAPGQPTEELTLWYNWDFGAAVKEVTYRDLARVESYYWLMYDTTDRAYNEGQWTMSCNSYERPDALLYSSWDNNATQELNDLNKGWFCSRIVGDNKVKSGAGAVVLPVEATTYGRENTTMPDDLGFKNLSVVEPSDHTTAVTRMKYLDEKELKLNVVTTNDNRVGVTPPYTQYHEELDRYGIHTYWRMRVDDEFGSAGVPSYADYYYYPDVVDGPDVRHANPPDEVFGPLSVDSVIYSLSRTAQRYFALSATRTVGAPDPEHPVTIHCYNVPPDGMSVEIAAIVYFNNGTAARKTCTITTSQEVAHADFRTPTKGPVIRGYVVGGGRVANVGYDAGNYTNNIISGGNTSITVHSCDSIYAIYGGNDIAGWVQGQATLQLGTAFTSAAHPVHIGYVYGGGCGYYAYENTYDALAFAAGEEPWAGSGVLSENLNYGEYCFRGNVYPWHTPSSAYSTTTPVATGFDYHPYDGTGGYDFNFAEKGQSGSGSIPYIKSSHIIVGVNVDAITGADEEETAALRAAQTVRNDNILIDSLFGGAENAFIGVTSNELANPANGVTIDINGGTIYSAFGGNNYGGSVAATATVFVHVHNTKLPTGYNVPFVPSLEDGEVVFTEGSGYYEATDSSYFDGYGREYGIRYLFGGGNLVDGTHANVQITGGMIDTCYLGGNRATVTRPIGVVNCTGDNLICTNPSYDQTLLSSSLGSDEYFGPKSWTGELGNYNIRCLFGGNNKARMETLAVIQLTSGGVSCVYGGGNAGDMVHRGGLTLPQFVPIMNQTMENTDDKVPWPTNIGSIVYTPKTSQIKCDYIFGGCRMANVWGSCGVVLKGGMFGYVNGGNDVSGDVGSTSWKVDPATGDSIGDASVGMRDGAYVHLDSNVVVVGDVVGGSDGYYHCDNGKGYYEDSPLYDTYSGENYDPYDQFVGMLLPTHNNTYVSIKGGLVKGNVIAGGAHANVGFDEDLSRNHILLDGVVSPINPQGGTKNGTIHLNMNGGVVEGDVFGGGYMSTVYGLSYIHVGGTAVIKGSLFAGNDLVGAIEGFGAYTDNLPTAERYEAYTASNGLPLNMNDGSWSALFSSYALIDGTPRIGCVYGGGNGAYNYTGDHPEYGPMVSFCDDDRAVTIPLQSSSFVDIHLTGNQHPLYPGEPCIDTVFGGGNGAGVRERVIVLLNCESNTNRMVGTIFGGNNRDDMASCVPNIMLKNGRVGDVFGGGNMGSMRGSGNFTDTCGNEVTGVSTRIRIDNNTAIVDGTVYGGCRMAEVGGMAYVEIRDGEVNNVFGGNDISGTVVGNTRIDVSGGTVHNIHGGSNGKYDYDYVDGAWDVYTFQSNTHDAATLQVKGTTGRPFVDSTTVNLYGGTITTDIFGGGALGDCRATNVIVNDKICPAKITTPDLTITGTLYAGGEGYWQDLNQPRYGNVVTTDDNTAACYLHLHHATVLRDGSGFAKAYGGGKGGDVENTYVYSYPTWDIPFQALYGGCWGSDVFMSTHMDLQGGDVGEAQTANNVYGGNDFTGSVGKTEITVRNGKYGFIYGGGNGDYPESYYTGAAGTVGGVNYGVYAGNYTAEDHAAHEGFVVGVAKRLYEPNNEYAEINFLDGTVDSNMFGGGKMGTTMRYKRDAQGAWLTQGGGASKQPDTFRSLTDGEGPIAHTPANAALVPDTSEAYSYIIINVHGGTFEHNIYAGGAGKAGGNWIVYGLKELNIDGGLVKESVYGGSENVNDGYARECQTTTNTNLRPSSIINLTGGTIKNHVYGGGYLGDVHGSVYVNIGLEAVNDCPVWTRDIYLGKDGSGDSVVDAHAYAKFKPGNSVWNKVLVPALTANELQLQASVYGGANWGNNVGNADFSKAGFYGGESRIRVDGEGYNTYMDDAHGSLPLMNIVNSLIGAGTSADGGDVYNRIDVRNYGAINGLCDATRQLRAIQRADAVWLENTAIDYTGSTDAISAYLSEQYTINRVDTLNCVGYNVVDVDATMTNIGCVNFLYTKEYSDYLLSFYGDENNPSNPMLERNTTWFEPSLQYMYVPRGMLLQASACADNATTCDKLHDFNRELDEYSFSAIVANNGINIDFIGENGEYSAIKGYGYLISEQGTNAVVTARSKYQGHNEGDGGFYSSCTKDMMAVKDNSTEVIEWCEECFLEDGSRNTSSPNYNLYCYDNDPDWLNDLFEYRYENYGTQYRMWTIGNGIRRRYAVVQAHSNPDMLYTEVTPGGEREYQNKKITLYWDNPSGTDSLLNLSLAKATLRLPPTTPGNYYKISGAGVEINDENAEMNMTDASYLPTGWDDLDNEWKIPSSKPHESEEAGNGYEADAHGEMQELQLSGGSGTLTGINFIEKSVSNRQYFGLMMSSGANFARDGSGNLVRPVTLPGGGTWTGGTTLSGNKNTNILTNFTTAQVGAEQNTMPEMDLFLLYNNNFSHTLLGTVTFTLEEYEAVPLRRDYNPETGVNAGPIVTAAQWYAYNHEAHPSWAERTSDYLDSNIHAPIEVEITITTILQDFADMEYEVLAMYNEGRLDRFERKVILPATLQRRELYLRGISWFPTDKSEGHGNGDTIRTAVNPTHFYLTNSTEEIKNQTPEDHSYFGMSILPTDNVSNTLVSAVGWHTVSVTEPINLYTEAIKQLGESGSTPKRVSSSSSNQDHYYQEVYNASSEPPQPQHRIDSVRIGGESDPGISLGVLDGRGEAAIKVTLDYDGNRIYSKNPGKGYVGKVVLTLVSYAGGDHSHGNYFHLIINVKTRDRGDTIYLASAPTVTRDGTTLTACTDFSSNSIDNGAGKKPSKYVQSFYDAFTKVYQEGDVIAIIDEVNINDQDGIMQTLIKGEEYMPVNVIRYTGSHDELPGNAGAYRGPMIVVDGANAALTTRCITFQGGMMGKVFPKDATEQAAQTAAGHTQTYDLLKGQDDPKYTDTTKAYGPIILVRNNGTVNLQNSTTVEYNYNGYSGADASRHGAISVTDGGKLNMVNNVTIEHNLSDSLAGSACSDWHIQPLNGAVYVDGGTVTLLESNPSTAVIIEDNFLYNTDVLYWKNSTVEVDVDPDPEVTDMQTKTTHTEYHPTNYIGTNTARTRANVWLARTEPTTVPDDITALGAAAIQAYKDTVDVKSAAIHFNKTLPENTHIGISKWFPDCAEALRDTIQVVFQADATHLVEAETNENFFSDNGYFVFYEYGVNNQRMFMGRCASFKFQHATEPASLLVAGSGIYTGDALSYDPLYSATCPIGGDQMVMRAQGGFYPYTYRWEDGNGTALKTPRRTSHSNLEVNKGIATSDFAPLRDAVADTFYTDRVEMAYSKTDSTIVYHVTVTDATDHCTLTKNVKLRLVKDISGNAIEHFTKTHVNAIDAHEDDVVVANRDAWTEVAYSTPNAVGDTARGERKYPAVKITPMVWTSGSGTIAAAVTDEASSNYIYYSDDLGDDHYLGGLALCEGDIIRLATSPTFHMEDDEDHPDYDPENHLPKKRVYDSKFIMWDFDPYYSNPVTYVVPAQNTTIIAYYGPLDYWIDVIDDPVKAKAGYDSSAYYSTRTWGEVEHNYVTTYNGDVHIYNEDGLAWFISVVNGLNGTQARPFYFNNVYLHDKTGGYDMKAHLWTPVGTVQHRFRGRFLGVGSGETDTTRLASPDQVVVKNIIVDEPYLENAGFFAWLDSATVASIKLQGALVRGSQYVGTFAARSVDSKLNNCYVESDEDGTTTTILTTHHTSGGMIGRSNHDEISNSTVKAKYVGDAVYSGGVVGYAENNDVIINTSGYNKSHMEGLYIGGIAGWYEGTAPYNSGAKTQNYARMQNNYIHLETDGRSQRVGGLVGYATNSLIENNYVYGAVVGSATEGGVGAVLDNGSWSDHNYYEQKAVSRTVGQRRGTAVESENTDFNGSGNQVQISEANYGVNNLTRVLNLWVRQHGNEYKTWRSDLENNNDGYPLYGQPDMIPVHDEFTYEGCDSIEWDGLLYTESVVLNSHVIDSLLMIDSTATLTLLVHHSVHEQYSDTADAGQPYSGYGFELSATETSLLRDPSLRHEAVTIILTDTLVTAAGCDSVITLALTLMPANGVVAADPNHLKVYPNPTTSRVTIETEGLTHVELYDNEGRRLRDFTTGNKWDMTIDVSTLPTGVYYLRIHTTDGVTIQKLIKK